jgi:thiosulfate/3-mercaptopyruvate sulfurtransferase
MWDARRVGEFSGEEVSKNRILGHVPDFVEVEWKSLLNSAPFEGGSQFIETVDVIKGVLLGTGLDLDRPVVTYCQAGIRGAFASFVLELLELKSHRLYDGPMAEWANNDEVQLRALSRVQEIDSIHGGTLFSKPLDKHWLLTQHTSNQGLW